MSISYAVQRGLYVDIQWDADWVQWSRNQFSEVAL